MTSALQDEAEWLPDKVAQLPAALKRVRTRLVDAGRSSAEVQGITGWLVGKALGEPDTTAAPTRSRYRRILREVGATDPTDDPKRSSRRPGAGSQPPIIIGAAGDVMSGRRRRKVAATVRAALDELPELPRGA